MAKSKYETHVKDKLILIEGWARNGLIEEQIAKNLGISIQTFYTYKNKYVEFFEALKKGKEVIDTEVENALLKKSLGFKEEVRKPFKIKRVEYHENGKKKLEYEEIVYAEDEIIFAPDTTAQIFWLKNRRPKDWRDRKDYEVSGLTTEEKVDTFIDTLTDEVKDE